MSARVRRQASRTPREERGAALVELGIVLPILAVLLFGTIDFGWTFSKQLDVQHGAREGARLIAVNYKPTDAAGSSQADEIATEVCRRMGGATGTTVTIRIPTQSGPVGRVGQSAEAEVTRPAASLSGLFAPLLDGRTLKSKVTTRLEVEATWATSYGTATSKECTA